MPTPTTRRRHSRTRRLVALAAALTIPAAVPSSNPAHADPGDTVDGRFSGTGIVEGGQTVEVDVSGRGGTSDSARMVAVNLTVTAPEEAGFATIYPCGERRPDASTVNYAAGQTIANGVLVKVGDQGRICIFTLSTTHLVVDVSGEVAHFSQFQAINPARLLDTREGFKTTDGRFAGIGRRRAQSTTEVEVVERGGTGRNPNSVAVNIAVTNVARAGFATIYPCGEERPNTSTVNYSAGSTIANSVIARVGDRGRICIYTLAEADIIVDVSGAVTSDDDYVSLTPARLLDTRPERSTVDGRAAGGGIRRNGSTLELDIADRGGSPADAQAVSINLTVTQAAEPGFATVYPCGDERPNASTVNFERDQTIANAVVTKVGHGGKVCIYIHGRTHVVADLDGYAPPGSSFRSIAPARLLDTRADTPPPPPVDDASSMSLRLLNQLRAQHGAGPVSIDAGMSATALDWSAEMSRTGFRHSDAGFAENIAWHSLSSMPPADAARRLHDMWVSSPGHFRNMINPRWNRVGIGMFVDSSGWYGTHMFDE